MSLPHAVLPAASWIVLLSISNATCVHTVSSWSVMAVVDPSQLNDLHAAIYTGNVEESSQSTCPVIFHETYREKPLSLMLGNKQPSPN